MFEQATAQEFTPAIPVENAIIRFLKSRLPGEKTARGMEQVDKLITNLPVNHQELASKLRPLVKTSMYASNLAGTYAEIMLTASLGLGVIALGKEGLRMVPAEDGTMKRKGLRGVFKDLNLGKIPRSLTEKPQLPLRTIRYPVELKHGVKNLDNHPALMSYEQMLEIATADFPDLAHTGPKFRTINSLYGRLIGPEDGRAIEEVIQNKIGSPQPITLSTETTNDYWKERFSLVRTLIGEHRQAAGHFLRAFIHRYESYTGNEAFYKNLSESHTSFDQTASDFARTGFVYATDIGGLQEYRRFLNNLRNTITRRGGDLSQIIEAMTQIIPEGRKDAYGQDFLSHLAHVEFPNLLSTKK